MPHEPTFGNPLGAHGPRTGLVRPDETNAQDKANCEARGGRWDEANKVCILPIKEGLPEQTQITPPRADPTKPEIFKDDKGEQSGIRLPDGRVFLGLSQEEIKQIADAEARKQALPQGTSLAGTAQAASDIAFQGEQLTGQVGEFEQLGISPTGLNVGEAATTGIVGALPTALKLGATGAALGLTGGVSVGALGGPVGAGAGAVIGAVAGFVGGFASSMIGNFKSQRKDTTTAQQRTLDEGKQTMKDWATLAKNDPVNKAQYLSEYNKQSAQIDQAYRQMKLDTSKDVAKFETALPNLAEFESFYSDGGERDTLNIEMRTALLAQPTDGYDMAELQFRRK